MILDLNNYKRHTNIITSDRLIFNSKDDSIINSSKKYFIVTSKEGIHFNNDSGKFIVNSPRVEFGLSSEGSLQPIAKGKETERILRRLLKSIHKFSSTLEKAQGVGAGVVDLPLIKSASTSLKIEVGQILRDVKNINSFTTYSI